MYQKTIKMFLYDGDPNSRIICELSNWDGIVHKIPRNMLKSCSEKDFDYIHNTGIYMLFWENDDVSKMYVGESENVYDRLLKHLKDDRNDWEYCIIFTRKDNSLNKAHVKYIEHELYQAAQKSARYDVDNSNVPTKSSLSMTDAAELKEVIDNVKLLTNSLMYKVFIDVSAQKRIDNNKLYMKSQTYDASGYETENGFIVEAGSKINPKEAESCRENNKALRRRLIEQGIIDNNYKFVDNYVFNSSSHAGCLIAGAHVSGPLYWKTSDNIPLRDLNKKS